MSHASARRPLPTSQALRRLIVAFASLAVTGAAACGDDDDGPTSTAPPAIAGVRLTVQRASGGAPVIVTVTSGSGGGAPIVFNAGASYDITAQPVNDQAQVITNAGPYELRLRDLPPGIAFTNSGSITARLVVTSVAAAKTVQADLYQTVEGRVDYTASFPVRVDP